MTALTVQLTPDDYIWANRLHARGNWPRVAAIVIFIFAVFSVSLDAGLRPPFHLSWRGFVAYGAVLLMIVGWMAILYLPIRYIFVPWRARRIFKQQKDLQQPFQVAWDADKLIVDTANANVRTPWSDFIRWRENDRLFLLYRSDVLFNMVPMRAFPGEAEIESFRGLLKENISPVAGRRRKV
jgi:hypothetical protein